MPSTLHKSLAALAVAVAATLAASPLSAPFREMLRLTRQDHE